MDFDNCTWIEIINDKTLDKNIIFQRIFKEITFNQNIHKRIYDLRPYVDHPDLVTILNYYQSLIQYGQTQIERCRSSEVNPVDIMGTSTWPLFYSSMFLFLWHHPKLLVYRTLHPELASYIEDGVDYDISLLDEMMKAFTPEEVTVCEDLF